MITASFTLTSLIVLISILTTGLLLINWWGGIEEKRLKKKYDERYPSAGRKYSKEINDKLDFDITDDFYNN